MENNSNNSNELGAYSNNSGMYMDDGDLYANKTKDNGYLHLDTAKDKELENILSIAKNKDKKEETDENLQKKQIY